MNKPTPSELKTQALRRLDVLLTQYMDGVIDTIDLSDGAGNIVNEFIDDFGEL